MERSDLRGTTITKQDYVALARWRKLLRTFLRFSENAARNERLTPQQHQILLAIAGQPDRDWMTIGELAEALQISHSAVVQILDRAQASGLVQREMSPDDHRVVRVSLADAGVAKLMRLTAAHRDELRRLHEDLTRLYPEIAPLGHYEKV